jgi:hypothetical protein
MATIVTRQTGATAKNSPLTNAEVDTNFIELNTNKFEKSGDIADYVDINTGATTSAAIGRVRWNDLAGTVDIGLKGGNVSIQLGETQVHRILNNTGSILSKGQVVFISGISIQKPIVQLADNTLVDINSKIIGIVSETITNGSEGFITVNGYLGGLDTSSFSVGSILWLGTAGAITATKPDVPNRAIMLGFCLGSDVSLGSIFVKIRHISQFNELHDVLIDSVSEDHTLVYEDGVWKNKSPADARTSLDVYSKPETTNISTDLAIAMAIALG